MGETDISSMTELIKSLRRFLYRGFRNFKGWGLRREELGACNVELAGVEATGSVLTFCAPAELWRGLRMGI